MHTGTLVRYTANAGFLLVRGDMALGIDLFASDPQGLYKDTPSPVREQLLAEIAAGNLNVLLFTHEHGDHFCVDDVVRACSLNPALRVFGNRQVCSALHGAGAAPGQVMGLKCGSMPLGSLFLNPPVQGRTDCVRILPAAHEGARYADVENLSILLYTGGQHLVFTGDAAPGDALFREIADWSREIDWMFVPFPAVGVGSSRRAMMRAFDRVGHVFACHLPRPSADVQQWTRRTLDVLQQLRSDKEHVFPDVIMPEHPGSWYLL